MRRSACLPCLFVALLALVNGALASSAAHSASKYASNPSIDAAFEAAPLSLCENDNVPVVEVMTEQYVVGSTKPIRFRGANLLSNNITALVLFLPSGSEVVGGFPRRLTLTANVPDPFAEPEFDLFASPCASSAVACPIGLFPVFLQQNNVAIPNGMASFVRFAFPTVARAVALVSLAYPLAFVADLQSGVSRLAEEALAYSETTEPLPTIHFSRPTADGDNGSLWQVGALALDGADARLALSRFFVLGQRPAARLQAVFSRFGIRTSRITDVWDELPCDVGVSARQCPGTGPHDDEPGAPPLVPRVVRVLFYTAGALLLVLLTLTALFCTRSLCFAPKHVTFDIDTDTDAESSSSSAAATSSSSAAASSAAGAVASGPGGYPMPHALGAALTTGHSLSHSSSHSSSGSGSGLGMGPFSPSDLAVPQQHGAAVAAWASAGSPAVNSSKTAAVDGHSSKAGAKKPAVPSPRSGYERLGGDDDGAGLQWRDPGLGGAD